MTSDFEHLILSPHFDDAALSCGGHIRQLTRRGQAVLVVTLFAGRHGSPLSTFAQRLHQQWGNPADVIATRLAEDANAMQILGADYVRLNFRDCIYRGVPDGREWYYTDEVALFGQIHPAENHLPDELAAAIAELLPAEREITVYAPLAVGHHVDHQLTHLAALRLDRPNWSVVFYEDYPYADSPGALELAQETLGVLGWTPHTLPFSQADLAAKIEAVRAYQSQLAVLFFDEQTMVERVTAYAQRIGAGQPAERLWQADSL